MAVSLHVITLKNALLGSHGQAILSVTGGAIARRLVEKASSDLNALFRKSEGMIPIECFVVTGNLADSTVTLGPIHLRARDAAFDGLGGVDLLRMNVDIVVQPRSDGFLALDQPLHIVGPLSKPSIAPFKGNAAALPSTAACRN